MLSFAIAQGGQWWAVAVRRLGEVPDNGDVEPTENGAFIIRPRFVLSVLSY